MSDKINKIGEWICGGCLAWASAVTLNQAIEIITLIYFAVQIFTSIPGILKAWEVLKNKFKKKE